MGRRCGRVCRVALFFWGRKHEVPRLVLTAGAARSGARDDIGFRELGAAGATNFLVGGDTSEGARV